MLLMSPRKREDIVSAEVYWIWGVYGKLGISECEPLTDFFSNIRPPP